MKTPGEMPSSKASRSSLGSDHEEKARCPSPGRFDRGFGVALHYWLEIWPTKLRARYFENQVTFLRMGSII